MLIESMVYSRFLPLAMPSVEGLAVGPVDRCSYVERITAVNPVLSSLPLAINHECTRNASLTTLSDKVTAQPLKGNCDMPKVNPKTDLPALKSTKEIGQMITTALALVGKGFQAVHEAGYQALAHACAHGDTGPMQRLIVGLNSHSSGRPVSIWAGKFGPFKADGKLSDGTFKLSLRDKWKPSDFKLTEAWATPFWNVQANVNQDDKAVTVEDIAKRIDSLIRYVRNLGDGSVNNRHLAEGADPKALEVALETCKVTFIDAYKRSKGKATTPAPAPRTQRRAPAPKRQAAA